MNVINQRYVGKIKVVGEDLMCFPVDPETLQPMGVSYYDPYVFTDLEPEPIETITLEEWNRRQADKGQRP